MTIKLTAASFLSGIKQSGLVEPDRVDALMLELQQKGVDCQDSRAIAAALVERNVLTEWQSEKLLQGRHKGFLLGRYRLLSLLGAGEMSAVYLAEHVMMERRCAIKVLPANKVQDTSYLGRFHREARAVAAMNHPNIVRAYDVDKQTESGTDIHFLVMEFVEGRNLEQIIRDQGPLDYVSAVDYIRQAADGLGHAHHNGMVHRDVKPGNLLVDGHGLVKLLDLGLARFFKTTDEESLTIKHDEKVLGTADYLAPEQAVDSHQVDSRADIYSLGCTLYFALTGHPPFTDGTLVQRLLAHQTKSPPSVKYDRPDIPDDLLDILEKMMAKKPADRYQTASEVSEALARWLIQHASPLWKQKHLMLVASLCGFDSFESDKSMAATVDAVNAQPGSSVLAAESMAADRVASGATPSDVVGARVPRAKPRRSSSVRKNRELLLAAAQKDEPPVQELASKLTPPAMPTLQPPTPASAPIPLTFSGLMKDENGRTLVFGMGLLGTIVVFSFLMWLFMSQGNNDSANKPEENPPAATSS